ncbi:MAG: hypothetical protein JW839_02085 [Candidatus Lokiarchaeota archaeon]|nr:hypothetical protein [Candidatus Lokiarchaeota archaeon]
MTEQIEDPVILAARDCALAKRRVKELENDAKDMRLEMDMSREKLVELEMERAGVKRWLDLPKRLSYKVGQLEEGGLPLELQLRAVDTVARGKRYSPEDQARIDEYRKSIEAIDEEIEAIKPLEVIEDPVRSWQVWLVADEADGKRKPAWSKEGAYNKGASP